MGDLKDENGDRSSDEKAVNTIFNPANVYDMPPDPDEHMSAAEKAAIVSLRICTHYLYTSLMIAHRIVNSSGSLISLSSHG